ncbi:hypothetical protein [Streptomyces sp. NPDC051219]|uniref:hypothetical protein n=1 Tax=Streptomyces sp. NPDC051219 TaxID=3155283 RepID=UPI003415BD94
MRVKRTGVAALLTVPALLLTACSGGPSGRAGENKGGASSAAAFAPLEKAALERSDLPGYQVSKEGKDPSAPDGQPRADKKECQPLADIMGDQPDPAARATVNRGLGSQKQLGLAISASLSSYDEPAAKKVISRLESAVAVCGSGFTATVQKQTGTYTAVRATDFDVAGDESVSYTLSASAQGVSAPLHLVIVRQKSTIVRLMAIDVAAKQKPRVPHEVADKQLAKVSRTLG